MQEIFLCSWPNSLSSRRGRVERTQLARLESYHWTRYAKLWAYIHLQLQRWTLLHSALSYLRAEQMIAMHLNRHSSCLMRHNLSHVAVLRSFFDSFCYSRYYSPYSWWSLPKIAIAIEAKLEALAISSFKVNSDQDLLNFLTSRACQGPNHFLTSATPSTSLDECIGWSQYLEDQPIGLKSFLFNIIIEILNILNIE